MRLDSPSIIPALLIVFNSLEGACVAMDVDSLLRSGYRMSTTGKATLEERVAKNPNDVESRIKLLGYYCFKGRNDADGRVNREHHIVWLIENFPESEVLGRPEGVLHGPAEQEGYDRAKQAWKKVLEESPEELPILRNAANFFLLQDSSFSEELLLKGQELDSNDPDWPSSLGQLYSLQLNSIPEGPARKAAAEKAFQHFKLAHELSDPMLQEFHLIDLAKTALAADRLDDAKAFATKLLDDDSGEWNSGNRIHHGNLILGQIALLGGDVDEAKSRLLFAGRTTGSPQLNSFGPNMLLAKKLLDRGESAVVLEYFELCRKFWKLGERDLDQWADDVKANRIPDFGANLVY